MLFMYSNLSIKLLFQFVIYQHTVKPALSGQSKIDKTKTLMTNGSLMKVQSIAECILQYFWPVLSKKWSWNGV